VHKTLDRLVRRWRAIRSTIKRCLSKVWKFLRKPFGKNAMEDKTHRLGYHLVIFLDVQGQREKFKGLRLPKTSEEHAAVQEVLKHTTGFVVGLRAAFRKNFAAFEAGISGKVGYLQPRLVGFSDSFVVSVPLAPVNGDMEPLVRIFAALSAASTIMMTAFASKHAVRGGIEVGLGVEIGPEEIYGTALGDAYELESTFAKYSRVLIGKIFWDYLSAAGREFHARKADALCAMVQKIMGLTAVENEERYLDYIGEVMSQLAKPGEAKIMVQPGYDFIVAEHERFIAAKDERLAERYGKLRGYYESRLPLWALDKE
jgi:hypothetical protein